MDKLNPATFTIAPKQWVTYTRAIGISTKLGRNGDTYEHPLLAFEFAGS